MRRRAAVLAAPFSAVLLAVSGCNAIPEDWKTPAFMQSQKEELDERLPTVTGKVGSEPEVKFPKIAPPEEQVSGVVKEGEGEGNLVRSDDMVLANIVDYQWTAKGDTEKSQSTYETDTPVLLELSQMGEELTSDLVDRRVGSRLVFVFPSQNGQQSQPGQPSPKPGSSVSVVDIEKRYGKGDTVSGKQTTNGGDGLPAVRDEGSEQPDISIPEDTDPPEDLETVELIEGEGPKVEKEQQAVVQYTGMSWNNGEVFDSTWKRGGTPTAFPVGVGQMVEGWDKGITGQKVGSRVMLVVPEDMAYGEDAGSGNAPEGTLVFVVDILGAVDQPPAQGENSGGSGDENSEKDKEE